MARTPYEVRLDTLCLAKDILSENAHAQREQQGKKNDWLRTAPADAGDPEFKDYEFTVGDVIEKAKALYDFIAPEGDAPKAKF